MHDGYKTWRILVHLTRKAYRCRLLQKSGLGSSIWVFSDGTQLGPVHQPPACWHCLIAQADPATGAASQGIGAALLLWHIYRSIPIQKSPGRRSKFVWLENVISQSSPLFLAFCVSLKGYFLSPKAFRSPLALLVLHPLYGIEYTFIGIKAILYYNILVPFLWRPWHFTRRYVMKAKDSGGFHANHWIACQTLYLEILIHSFVRGKCVSWSDMDVNLSWSLMVCWSDFQWHWCTYQICPVLLYFPYTSSLRLAGQRGSLPAGHSSLKAVVHRKISR